MAALTDLLPQPLRKTARKLRRRVVPARIQVVYHEGYNHAFADVPADPLRAERILAFLASEGLVLRRHVHRPEPVTLKDLERVHAAEYLDSVNRVEVLTSILGTEVYPAVVDRILDFQRLQSGGTLLAFRCARRHGLGINLGGGYHHAADDEGAGFCVFNDVAVAIGDARRRGFLEPILVVDLDLHDGDGTRDIFRHDRSVHTFSIHARHWQDVESVESAVESTAIELGSDVGDAEFLGVLRRELPPLVERFDPGLVVYLAGVDGARDDAMGSWKLTAEALLERDRLVRRLAREECSVPLVVVLAGGYGPEAWRYSARFLSDLERPGEPIEPPSTDVITLKRYRYISSLFDPAELSGGPDEDEADDDNLGITAEDVMLPGWTQQRETRFLGFYTRHGIELVLERSGFLDRLRDLGFQHPTLDFHLEDPGGQTVRLWGDPDQRELLVEIRLLRDRRSVPGMELLRVEWLLMQNPRTEFSPERPPLPGQEHPGLGMLQDLVALLIVACERLHLDGLVFVPSQFHVAAYGRSHMRFLRPETQRRFDALFRFFSDAGTGFAEATRAVAEGRVRDRESGEIVRWRPEPMVLPVSERMEDAVRTLRRDARERDEKREADPTDETPLYRRLELLPPSRATSSEPSPSPPAGTPA